MSFLQGQYNIEKTLKNVFEIPILHFNMKLKL